MIDPQQPCPDHCDCAPTGPGYFWATHRKYGWRRVVLVERNGHGHVRAFVHRMSGSFGLEEFRDYKAISEEPCQSQ